MNQSMMLLVLKSICDVTPCSLELLQYFSANGQCFSLTKNQHKHQHKLNFNERTALIGAISRVTLKHVLLPCL
jgi:hypothetical protein